MLRQSTKLLTDTVGSVGTVVALVNHATTVACDIGTLHLDSWHSNAKRRFVLHELEAQKALEEAEKKLGLSQPNQTTNP